METMAKVIMLTNEFFKLHWNNNIIGSQPPPWSAPWKFEGTQRNGDRQGCYVLLKGDEVLYIGIGASIGDAPYEGCGIGKRTNIYWQLAEGQRSVPCEERRYLPAKIWAERGLDGIAALGFEMGYGYLAYALEAYLISRCLTQYNSNKPGAGPK
jgi:hypothetical protein